MRVAIPVQLSILVAEKKLYKEYQLFLYLKYLSDSKVVLCKSKFKILELLLEVNEATIRKYLVRLLGRNWIGYDSNANLYIVRGFKEVMKMEGLKSQLIARLSFEDLDNIKAIIGVSIFGHCYRNSKYKIHKKNWKKKKDRGRGRLKKEGPKQRSHPSYYPVSIGGVENLIHVSMSNICRLKKKAIEAGLLDAKHCLIPIDLPRSEWNYIIKYKFPTKGKYVVKSKKLYLSLPDLVKPQIALVRSHHLK